MDRSKSIELLNKAVGDELSAVHQYMYFHFILDDLGYDLLANIFKRTAIEEMMHIERFAERILFLGGDVEMKASSEVIKEKDPENMLKWAMDSEEGAIVDYNKWAMECANASDSMSKQLFESIIADEERHFDQYDTEYQNLKKFGDRYLAQQAMERSKTVGGMMPPAN
jgi:bacterioferritin